MFARTVPDMDIEQLQNRVPDIVYFVDRRCFPDWEIVEQRIDFHDLTFVVEGRSVYRVNGVDYEARAGDMIYVPMGSVREAYTFKDDPMHSYAFNFNWLPGSSEPLPFQTVTKNVVTNELYGYMKQFAQVWMGKPPGYVMPARALFLFILHRLLVMSDRHDAPSPADARINKVLEYVSEHYSEELHLSDMAKLVNLHSVYLGKLFKKTTGHSFKEYVNQIRINHAEMLLSTGEFTVTQIADRCGFRDISYFSNVFKSIKGFPPSAVKG